MSSVCLNHQDRETDIRCAACLRPICQECVVVGPGNSKFCSADCRENAQKSSERFADMTRRDEEALRAARQATFSKMIVTLLILIALSTLLLAACGDREAYRAHRAERNKPRVVAMEHSGQVQCHPS